MSKKVIVKVCLETGETSIEAVGYNGSGCKDATKDFENALGNVEDRTVKATMWNKATETTGHIEAKS